MKKYSGSIIDIHSHILPCVDDGSHSFESSYSSLKDLIGMGVTDIILTPHYRGSYRMSPQELKEERDKFVGRVKKLNLPINFYLGQEVAVEKETKQALKDGTVMTMNDSKYVLLEFDFNVESEIAETVYDFINLGYKPIVAHLERYIYSNVEMAEEIKALGGLIQVNACSLVGDKQGNCRKRARQFLKRGLVDFVATDLHTYRKIFLREACDYVSKKLGEKEAEKIFCLNPKMIINKEYYQN